VHCGQCVSSVSEGSGDSVLHVESDFDALGRRHVAGYAIVSEMFRVA
jgi:hypothetical protein